MYDFFGEEGLSRRASREIFVVMEIIFKLKSVAGINKFMLEAMHCKRRHWFSFSVLFRMTMAILVAIMTMVVMVILIAIINCG